MLCNYIKLSILFEYKVVFVVNKEFIVCVGVVFDDINCDSLVILFIVDVSLKVVY